MSICVLVYILLSPCVFFLLRPVTPEVASSSLVGPAIKNTPPLLGGVFYGGADETRVTVV